MKHFTLNNLLKINLIAFFSLSSLAYGYGDKTHPNMSVDDKSMPAQVSVDDKSMPNQATATAHSTSSLTGQVVAKTPEEDAMITKSLTHLIKKSKVLSKLPVHFTTQKGVVSFSGNVDSNSQASMLIELASSIIGVADVDASNLTIKGSQHPFRDMITTAKIKGLFIRADLFNEKDIASINTSVETKNGVVYLTGLVDNQQQIDNAIDIIKKSIPEVKKVEYKVYKVIPGSKNHN